MRIILQISKGVIERWKLSEKNFLVEIVGVIVCSSRVKKMKEHLSF